MQRTRGIARWIEHPDQRPASDGIGGVLDQHTGQGDTYGAGAPIPHHTSAANAASAPSTSLSLSATDGAGMGRKVVANRQSSPVRSSVKSSGRLSDAGTSLISVWI